METYYSSFCKHQCSCMYWIHKWSRCSYRMSCSRLQRTRMACMVCSRDTGPWKCESTDSKWEIMTNHCILREITSWHLSKWRTSISFSSTSSYKSWFLFVLWCKIQTSEIGGSAEVKTRKANKKMNRISTLIPIQRNGNKTLFATHLYAKVDKDVGVLEGNERH